MQLLPLVFIRRQAKGSLASGRYNGQVVSDGGADGWQQLTDAASFVNPELIGHEQKKPATTWMDGCHLCREPPLAALIQLFLPNAISLPALHRNSVTRQSLIIFQQVKRCNELATTTERWTLVASCMFLETIKEITRCAHQATNT